MKNDIIELEGMEFHSFHGCLEQERVTGNTFMVDFKAYVDISKAVSSDDLADTIDYGRIYDIVAAVMQTPSNLLEHVAGRIEQAVAKEFPEIGFAVRVSKKNPPVSGTASWSRVTLFHDVPKD